MSSDSARVRKRRSSTVNSDEMQSLRSRAANRAVRSLGFPDTCRLGANRRRFNLMTTPRSQKIRPSARGRAEAKVAERRAVREDSQVDQARLFHELEVHQVELEMQLEANQTTRAELEAITHRYADLYAFAPVAYFTLESDSAIRELNLAGSKLLGAERAQFAGRRFGVFVAEASRPTFFSFLEEVFATNAKRTCDIELASEGRASIAVTLEETLSSDGRECRAVG